MATGKGRSDTTLALAAHDRVTTTDVSRSPGKKSQKECRDRALVLVLRNGQWVRDLFEKTRRVLTSRSGATFFADAVWGCRRSTGVFIHFDEELTPWGVSAPPISADP